MRTRRVSPAKSEATGTNVSVAYLLAAVTVLLPLANSDQFYWRATTPKALLLQTAAAFIVLLFVNHLAAGREVRVPGHPAVRLVVALLALTVASTLTAVNRATAVFPLYPEAKEAIVRIERR